jgi:hypothetical protein
VQFVEEFIDKPVSICHSPTIKPAKCRPAQDSGTHAACVENVCGGMARSPA